jgi:hypothetical protein
VHAVVLRSFLCLSLFWCATPWLGTDCAERTDINFDVRFETTFLKRLGTPDYVLTNHPGIGFAAQVVACAAIFLFASHIACAQCTIN